MIIIDPGHGGSSRGVVGNGIVEKDFNLKISQYIYGRLQKLGIPTSITRLGDVTLNDTDRYNRIREFAGDLPDTILISNHLNRGNQGGAEIAYSLKNRGTLARLLNTNLQQAGQNTIKYYQRRLPSNTSEDYYALLREAPSNVQPLIIEYGSVDNLDDVKKLNDSWQQYAEAVIRTIASYVDVPYTSVSFENVYIVKPGDTLYSIARNYGITVGGLKELNQLSSDNLTVGQELLIPQLSAPAPQEENMYTVKSGDTLYSIAQKLNTSVDAIKEINNLTSNVLTVGQKLIIPEVKPLKNIYTVKSGDSLYSIATQFNTTVEAIRVTNNLMSNVLTIGQHLVIPKPATASSGPTIYSVKSGDSLYSIANEFNTTVEAIKAANKLTSNILTIGQELIIPI